MKHLAGIVTQAPRWGEPFGWDFVPEVDKAILADLAHPPIGEAHSLTGHGRRFVLSKGFQLGKRVSGVLLYPTSLPGPHGCGDLGAQAYRFADFLADSGQRAWQMLPITPSDKHGCPYSAYSSFAGEPILISLQSLFEDGLLKRGEVAAIKGVKPTRVDYTAVRRYREPRLRIAFDRYMRTGPVP